MIAADTNAKDRRHHNQAAPEFAQNALCRTGHKWMIILLAGNMQGAAANGEEKARSAHKHELRQKYCYRDRGGKFA